MPRAHRKRQRAPEEFPVGSEVDFTVGGRYKVTVIGAEVVDHDGDFVICIDAQGRTRKVRPRSIHW